jgi:hypothetical protein
MSDTPVEVQFTSAGCLNYPCRTPIGSKIVNRQGQGFWLDIALGIVGALVGGFLFDLFGASGVTGLNIYTGILRMNSEPPRIFAFSPRLGKPGWRRGRLSSPLTLRTAAEGADLAIFANIWTHSSLRSPLNA